MKETQIVILSHWHAASSLVSKTLKEGGMFVGNKNTFWDDSCNANCEHGLLNNTMADILYNGVKQESLNTIEKVLISYKKEPKSFYGVKVTHGLQTWDIIKDIFKKQWPNAKYIVGIQHPLGIIKTLRTRSHSKEWPDERILKSWLSIESAADELINDGAYVVDCHSSWPKGINKILSSLKIKPVATAVYDRSRIYNISRKEKFEFKKSHPKSNKLYEKLIKSVIK